MSVPYAVNQGNLRHEIEVFNNVYYVAGQGGIIIQSQKLQYVLNAGVLSAYSGNSRISLQVSVLNTGLQTGTVGTVPPVTNGIHIFVQQISEGVVEEYPTGTIPGPIILLTEGN